MFKLFAVGFPRTMSEQALAAFFGDFGDLHSVTLITDKISGQSKGYAFISFMDEISANLAIKELHGSELNGRILNVRYADQKENQSFPAAESGHQPDRFTASPERIKRPRIPKL